MENSERSFSLIMTMMVMLIMTVMGLSYLVVSDTENQISVADRDARQVLYVALSGAKIAESWFDVPRAPDHPRYREMSRRIQAKLKELIPFGYFQDPARYADLEAAGALLLYAAIEPWSPAVMVAMRTEYPARWSRTSVPAHRNSISSGCAINANTVGMATGYHVTNSPSPAKACWQQVGTADSRRWTPILIGSIGVNRRFLPDTKTQRIS